jgi:SMC interacting uncharacterized protein involved in chromosome segregation
MMQHYAIDALSEYRTEAIPDTKRPVVNPAWRELDRQLRSVKSKLIRRQACFAALTLRSEADEAKAAQWEQQKSALREEVEQLEEDVKSLKKQMDSTPHHLTWAEFPEASKFERLAPSRKRLTDTVKLVCYRSETALSDVLRESLRRSDDSRSLLRDLFSSSADVIPDCAKQELTIRVHTLSNPRSNRAVEHLLAHLNATETTYPGTEYRLRFTLSEPKNDVTETSARDQES